jgi:hypothetical protein
VVEPRDDHGDDGDDHKMINGSVRKEEREKQNAKDDHKMIKDC